MDPLRLWYRGLPLMLTPITDEEEGRIYGYGLTCPKCQREFLLNTGIGPKPDHYLSRNSQNQITILPAIRCAFHCGWCVRVVDDMAFLCRRENDR